MMQLKLQGTDLEIRPTKCSQLARILWNENRRSPEMPADFTVENYMARQLVTIQPDANISEAIALLLKHHISGMPVVDDAGRLVGVLSEQDCLKSFVNAQYYEEPTTRVRDLMSAKPETVEPKTDILKVAEFFLNNNYRRLPVLEGDRLVGQISRRDVLRAIQKAGGNK
jgi:CBS domain-containing protein